MIVFATVAVSVLLTGLLVSVAPLLGWFDRREGLEYRKPIEENIPVVGGAAVLGAMALASYLDPGILLPWPALIGAFVLGLIDDVRRGGLSPAVKLSGQITVATLLIVVPGSGFADHSSADLLTMAAVALVAMNAVNLFDHADGMAGTACCIALGQGSAVLAAAVGGYLPFNTFLRNRKTFRESVPLAMLGDSGTHLLGVAIAVTPGAASLLLVPLLDAARVMVGRTLRGQPFWEGDRTHLGNRLAGIGFGPISTSLVVALLVSPPILLETVTGSAESRPVGLVLSVVLYILAVLSTRGYVAPALQTREAADRPPSMPLPEEDDGSDVDPQPGGDSGPAEPEVQVSELRDELMPPRGGDEGKPRAGLGADPGHPGPSEGRPSDQIPTPPEPAGGSRHPHPLTGPGAASAAGRGSVPETIGESD